MADSDTDSRDPDAIADRVIDRLETGSYGDKLLLSRRQVLGLSTGALSLGALGGVGAGDAQAQSAAGQVGTASAPVDVEAASVNAGSVKADESRTTPRTVTVNVPTDFSSVATAIAEIDAIRRTPGLRFEVFIESGHKWQQEVTVEDTDLGHVTITSADAEVQYDNTNISSALSVFNAVGPIWDTVYAGHGNGLGVAVRDGGYLFITPGSGAKNTTTAISLNNGAEVFGDGAVGVGSDRGISATSSSEAHVENADFSGNNNYGVRAGGGSFVNAKFIDATNTGNSETTAALRASNHSTVVAHNSDVSGSTHAISITQGWVHAKDFTANNLTYDLIRGSSFYAHTPQTGTRIDPDIIDHKPAGYEDVVDYRDGSEGMRTRTGPVTLADEEQIALVSPINGGRAAMGSVRATGDNRSIVFAASNSVVNSLADDGSWVTTDTDGSNCLFFDGTDLVLKNRSGASQTYTTGLFTGE